MACQSDMVALLREAALFMPGYERDSPVAPSDFDRLVGGALLCVVMYVSQARLACNPTDDQGTLLTTTM